LVAPALSLLFLRLLRATPSTLFPYSTLFRSRAGALPDCDLATARPSAPETRYNAPAQLPEDHQTTFCSCTPSPSTDSRITSPRFRKRLGFMPSPTPGGVPVVTMSPASRIMKRDR